MTEEKSEERRYLKARWVILNRTRPQPGSASLSSLGSARQIFRREAPPPSLIHGAHLAETTRLVTFSRSSSGSSSLDALAFSGDGCDEARCVLVDDSQSVRRMARSSVRGRRGGSIGIFAGPLVHARGAVHGPGDADR